MGKRKPNLYGLEPTPETETKKSEGPKTLFTIGPGELMVMIEDALKGRNNSYDYYAYFILDENTVLVKVAEYNIVFNVKMRLNGDKLEIVEVS